MRLHDLTAVERDVLRSIALLEKEGDKQHGLGILERMKDGDVGYTDVNHSRLYPTLDSLEDRLFITRSAYDKRTNKYELTPDGKLAVKKYAERWSHAVEDEQ